MIGRSPTAAAWLPISGFQPEMLEVFYASVEAEHGSMDVFLAEIGVDDQARSELVAAFTLELKELAGFD